MVLRKAEKKKTKLRIGLAGTSGSGKTYSALLLAHGLCSAWDKIAVIDTENGSADLYAGLGDYNVITLTAPFTPERYIEAIKECENAGMGVIIVDSITHEWDGKGGCLEIVESVTQASASKNSYTAWAKVTPRHNAFIQAILQSDCHVITTVRRKQDYDMGKDAGGKTVVSKVGLKEVTREGFEYELTLSFNLAQNHLVEASKDRTGLFMDKPEFVITKDTGKTLREWANDGSEAVVSKEPVKEDVTSLVSEDEKKDKYVETPSGKALSRAYYAVAKKAGYDSEKAHDLVVNNFKLESYTEVTKEQLNKAIEVMKDKIGKEGK